MNRLDLLAEVAQTQTLRHTPAGIPVLHLVLSHQSTLEELGMPRKVALQLRAVAFGSIAEQLAVSPCFGQPLRWQGFLAQARQGQGVLFHIQSYQPNQEHPHARTETFQ